MNRLSGIGFLVAVLATISCGTEGVGERMEDWCEAHVNACGFSAAPTPYAPTTVGAEAFDPASVHLDRITMRFEQCTDVRLENGVFVSTELGLDLTEVNAWLGTQPVASVARQFQTDDQTLETNRCDQEKTAGEVLPDFRLYYEIRLNANPEPQALLEGLAAVRWVERASYPVNTVPAAAP